VGAWLLIPSALESFPQVSLLLLKVSTANTEICGRLAVDTFSTDHFGVFSLGVTALRPEGINSQHRNPCAWLLIPSALTTLGIFLRLVLDCLKVSTANTEQPASSWKTAEHVI